MCVSQRWTFQWRSQAGGSRGSCHPRRTGQRKTLLLNQEIIHYLGTQKVKIYTQNAPKYIWRPGSAQTRWESFSAAPDPLAAIEGAYF